MVPGPTELLLILLIVVVVFGAKRIPEIMQGLGKGIREFKNAMEHDDEQVTGRSQSTLNTLPQESPKDQKREESPKEGPTPKT